MRLFVVLATLALGLLAAPTASAVRSEFFGIAHGPALDAQDLQGMRDARIRTDRMLLLWRRVQPSQGSFDWSEYDPLVGRFASRGIRPVPFLYGTPAWVGTGQLTRPPLDSAADVQAWVDFLQAALARYGPGGSYWANDYQQDYPGATPLPVQSWQIWNEPNLKRFWAAGAVVQAVRPAASDLPRRDQEPEPAGPDRPRRTVQPGGREGLDLPQQPLRECPGSRTTSTSPPCTPTAAPWIRLARGS